MKIDIELNEAQEKAFMEILPLMGAQKQKTLTPEMFVKEVVVEVLITNKKILIEKELR